MNISSIALTGFFVWSSLVGSPTHIPASSLETSPVIPAGARGTRTVLLTAYNAVPEQTDSTPFITASGLPTNSEITAARSRDLAAELPFGTIIALETPTKSHSCGFSTVEHLIGYRVIADTMHERMQNKIDVLLDQNDRVSVGVNGQPKKEVNPARALGICEVKMRVVGKIPLKDIPETQAELALMVRNSLALSEN